MPSSWWVLSSMFIEKMLIIKFLFRNSLPKPIWTCNLLIDFVRSSQSWPTGLARTLPATSPASMRLQVPTTSRRPEAVKRAANSRVLRCWYACGCWLLDCEGVEIDYLGRMALGFPEMTIWQSLLDLLAFLWQSVCTILLTAEDVLSKWVLFYTL